MSYWNNELHIFQKGVEMVELILLGDTPRPHSLLFSGAEKRSKRDIHPYPTSPYMGKLKKNIAARRRYFLCFGIAGRRDKFFIGLRKPFKAY